MKHEKGQNLKANQKQKIVKGLAQKYFKTLTTEGKEAELAATEQQQKFDETNTEEVVAFKKTQ